MVYALQLEGIPGLLDGDSVIRLARHAIFTADLYSWLELRFTWGSTARVSGSQVTMYGSWVRTGEMYQVCWMLAVSSSMPSMPLSGLLTDCWGLAFTQVRVCGSRVRGGWKAKGHTRSAGW